MFEGLADLFFVVWSKLPNLKKCLLDFLVHSSYLIVFLLKVFWERYLLEILLVLVFCGLSCLSYPFSLIHNLKFIVQK